MPEQQGQKDDGVSSIIVSVRNDDQPYGTGTKIRFRARPGEQAIDRVVEWLVLCMDSNNQKDGKK